MQPEDALDIPIYDRALAAAYLRVPPRTLDYWLDGDAKHLPIVRLERTEQRSLTWGEFVECWYVVEYTRVHNTPMRELRRIMARGSGQKYPLAYEKYLSAPGGRLATIEKDGVVLPADGQIGLPEVTKAFLRKVDFDAQSGAAKTIFPLGRESNVRIEPTVSYGAPHVNGIRTENIAELARAGESPSRIKEDFELTDEQLRDALNFEQFENAA